VCGRYVLATSLPVLASYFDADYGRELEELPPSWNVAPTDVVPALTADADGARRIAHYRWGLVPSWSKGLSYGANTINARAESIATKPSFRSAFRSRRCIVPADGYFEWATTPSELKQPYYLLRADGAPLAFAGLWEAWPAPVSPGQPTHWVHTCAIVTTAASSDVDAVHHRMPAILEPGDASSRWLDPELHDRDELEALIRPAPAGTLLRRRVSSAVGNVRNNGAQLLDELPVGETTLF
jgi:putative SOS response-associated peptidase YedK